jgi:hypothetical protein
MTELHTTVRNYLNRQDWFYQEKEEKFSLFIQVMDYQLLCYVHVFEEARQVILHTIFPIKIPKNKFATILTIINKVNCETTIGNFELDTENCDLRYKTSVDVENAEFTVHTFENLLSANFNVSVENYPQIISIVNQKQKKVKED